MLRARPARFNESLLEGRPGAKDAHPGIADREIPLRGEVFHRHALHINRLQCIGVLRFESARQASNTAANFSFDFRFRRGVRLELGRERLQRPAGGLAPSKSIDCGVSECSIEPRHETFVDRSLVRPLHHLDESILQDVFGQLAVPDTAFEIAQENAMVLEQDVERSRRVIR
ncbi:MAG TPA: hypothetical protein VL262_03715 [Vicinamibacterales bacterium]|nr:hypothetical protein [Vicinamibacterales bacterium]